MPLYRVIWEIELDATTARKAAEKALAIQRDHTSIATFFEVKDEIKGITHRVDLMPLEGVKEKGNKKRA